MKPSTFGTFLLLVAGLAAAQPVGARETGPYWPAAKRDASVRKDPGPLGAVWTVADDTDDARPTPPVKAKAARKAAKSMAKPAAKHKMPARSAAAKKAASLVKAAPVAKPAPQIPAKTTAKTTPKSITPAQAKPATVAKPQPPAAKRPAAKPVPAKPQAAASAASTADAIILADARTGCSNKDANACLILGRMYVTGTIAAKDEPAAARTFKQSCDLGNGAGCHALGMMYEKGAKAAEATRYYKMACKLGNAPACKSSLKAPGKVEGARLNLGELLFPKKAPVS